MNYNNQPNYHDSVNQNYATNNNNYKQTTNFSNKQVKQNTKEIKEEKPSGRLEIQDGDGKEPEPEDVHVQHVLGKFSAIPKRGIRFYSVACRYV